LLLILANGFFVAAEFALVAVDPNRVEFSADAGGRRARLARGLLGRLSLHLSGAQLGITVTSLLIGIVAEPSIAHLLEPVLEPLVGARATAGFSLALAIGLATVVQMVVGELIPKGLAIARPETTTLLLAPVIRIYGIVFGPLIKLLDNAANAAVRLIGIEPTEELSRVRTLPELQALVEASAEGGTLDVSASQLLTRTIRFDRKVAEDVLIPRTSVVAIHYEASVQDLVDLALRSGHSRFIVHGEDLDELVGVVEIRRVHQVPSALRSTTPVGSLVQQVLMVPESRALDELLIDLRVGDAQLAVVVDEYGGTAGIVTLEDILEEILGEIADEHDTEPQTSSRATRAGEWMLVGTLHPDEVSDATSFELPEGEYETLAGFMLDRLGHIPGTGEIVEFAGWSLQVASMDRRRIAMVRVQSPTFDGPRTPSSGSRSLPGRRTEP